MEQKQPTYCQLYYQKNRERIRQKYNDHPELNKERRKKRYQANRDKILQQTKETYKRTKEKRFEYARKRREHNNYLCRMRNKNNPTVKLRNILGGRIYDALKNNKGIKKVLKTEELLGCTVAEARSYIESLWLPDMSWNNYSLHGWHVDHIIPLNTFDLSDIEQQKKAFHYTNLRPLWSTDNLQRPKSGSDVLV